MGYLWTLTHQTIIINWCFHCYLDSQMKWILQLMYVLFFQMKASMSCSLKRTLKSSRYCLLMLGYLMTVSMWHFCNRKINTCLLLFFFPQPLVIKLFVLCYPVIYLYLVLFFFFPFFLSYCLYQTWALQILFKLDNLKQCHLTI